MKKKFSFLVFMVSLFLLFGPFAQQKGFSQIPTESFHNIEFAFEDGVMNNRIDVGLEYGYQFGFANYFSVYPYGKLNFLGFKPMIDGMAPLGWVNTWAGEDTVALNFLLLGVPYMIAGFAVLFQTQYLFDLGVDVAYHPFVTEYFDSSISIGLENSPLKYYRGTHGEQVGTLLYPFYKTKIEVNGKYKLGMISAWAEYQFDIFYAAKALEKNVNCSDFNIGFGISLIPGRD